MNPPQGHRFFINLPDATTEEEVKDFLLQAYGKLCCDRAIIVPGSERLLRDAKGKQSWVTKKTGFTVFVPISLRI